MRWPITCVSPEYGSCPGGTLRGMTINLAAVLYLIALILFLVNLIFAPLSPRVTQAGLAAVAAGLFCSATGLGG